MKILTSLNSSTLEFLKKLSQLTFCILLLLVSQLSVSAQTEAEIEQEIGNYALEHTESETQQYVTDKINQMTVQAYWDDYNLSLLSGVFSDSSQCLRDKQAICDHQFLAALARLTGESAVLSAACAAISTSNPWLFVACISAVIVRHAAQLIAIKEDHQACLAKARLECFATAGACVPQPLIVQWCTAYNFDSCTCDEIVEKSPIVIDVLGNGISLTDGQKGVYFDITNTQRPELLSWTEAGSDDAFLTLDLNHNGVIDSGAELFGNFTPQPPPIDGRDRNGFWALTGFDANRDGKINELDPIFSSLRLWQDVNHNGKSEPAELHTLGELGLKEIDLTYRESGRRDRFGNYFRYRAKVTDFQKAQLGRWAWDVFLVN